jgi:DNA replicative helicase MCM subunit Mcm2 (Cdc46/Mcm family)
MKKFALIILISLLALSLFACGKTKILHCDNCNKEVKVEQDSNMEEDWTIFCESCNEELFGDDPLLNGK